MTEHFHRLKLLQLFPFPAPIAYVCECGQTFPFSETAEYVNQLQDIIGELVGVYNACPIEEKQRIPMPIASHCGALFRFYRGSRFHG